MATLALMGSAAVQAGRGIDLEIHAETAYDLHSTAGTRSSSGFIAPRATSGPFAAGTD